MFQIFKQWWMPLAFIIATQISVVRADTIRVVGPDGQIKSSPTFSEPVRAQSLNQASEPSRFYGPTNGNETLWSIASRLRPDNSVSVQQTLLAIYRLNPQAFENQNIHSLVPSSYLRVPSLEQARASSTQQAIRIMDSHQAKLNAPSSQPVAPTKPEVTRPEAAKPDPVVKPETVEPKLELETKPAAPSKPLTSPQEDEVNQLEKQLEMSESELLSLEEKNHQLRLMLSNVQSEVELLKNELSDEDRIRNEVEKLLEEERQKNADIEKMAPSTLDQLLSNGWLVAALAIIPGLLIGLFIIMLLGRKSKQDEPQQAEQETNNLPEQNNVVPMPLDEEMADLDTELSLDDELFGADEDTEKLFDDEGSSEQEDVFAGLDDADLDFNLDGEDDDPFAGIGDDGDLDGSFEDIDLDSNDLDSNNGISVNGEEKALGLEEMERALDETVESALDSDEGDFDLSDDNPMSADDIEALLSQDAQTEDLGSNELDQSMLDDLFASSDDDDSFDLDTLVSEDDSSTTPGVSDDFDIDALISEQQSSADESPASTDTPDLGDEFDIDALISEQQSPAEPASNDDIDDIFAQVAEQSPADTENEFNLDEQEDLTSQFSSELASDDDIENILSQFDQPVPEEEGLIGDDLLSNSPELASNESTDLLDELLDGDDVDLSNSTDLLDDMLGDDDDTDQQEHLDLDPLTELEELSGLSEESEDDFKLDESSTELLDDFLDDDDTPLTLEEDETLDELLGNDLSESSLLESEAEETSESLEPFDELLTSGIDDLDLEQDVQSEESSFEQSLSSALEETAETSEASLGELEHSETTEVPELKEDSDQESAAERQSEALETESSLDGAEVRDEPTVPVEQESKDFNRNDFIGDMHDIAPQADALFDESTQHSDIAASDDAALETASVTEVTDESAIIDEDKLASPNVDNLDHDIASVEESPSQESESEPELEAFDESLPSEDLQESFEELLSQPEPEVKSTPNDLEDVLDADVEQQTPPQVTDEQALEDSTELEDDWLSAAIDDVESPQAVESNFDFAPKIEASEPQLDMEDSLSEPEPEPEPEPVRAANMPEIIPNEFGVPEDDDWLFEDDASSQPLMAEPQADETPAQEEPELATEAPIQESVTQEAQAPEQATEEEFSFDDLELPEFGEDDALEAVQDEPQLETETPALEQTAEEEFSFDDLELAEFDEDDALDAVQDEPQLETETPAPEQAAEEEFSFDELELPEFDEEDALDAVQNEPQLETETPETDTSAPEQAAEEDFSFDDLELPEFDEDDALDAVQDEPQLESEAPVQETVDQESSVQAPLAQEESAQEVLTSEVPTEERAAEEEFSFDDLELPDFEEEDALAEILSGEDDAQLEQDLTIDDNALELEESELPEYDEESAKADAVLDDIELQQPEPVSLEPGVELDESKLPEYGEDEALSDAFSEIGEPLNTYGAQAEEQDALHDLFSGANSFVSDEITSHQPEAEQPSSPVTQDEPLEGFDEFDESALAELLSEDVQDSVDSMFEQPMDDTAIDSAGLDIDAMLEVGGEDWKGFSLEPEQQSSLSHDVPDDQQEIWESAKRQVEPQIQEENWGAQDQLLEATAEKEQQFMTIDELMAQVEQENGEAVNPDEEELKLDVGLNEFPDVIGDIGNYDVDSNAEAAGKLDLAKIYIEMSDPQGAIKLLEEAIVDGSDDIRREAKNLIDTLNGR
ncbi:FimV/HubP family polar landmark protein [Vibrio pelagius]|uniref:FimV/HubP family polar landmark protein n=1 Tax=Vibrio pelagius TaxID=28169 RepID=UPI00355061DC